MTIKVDDLRGKEIAGLLEEHLHSMTLHSPPESIHALDLEALRKPEITFWSAWEDTQLLGCGALKELAADHGEVKSMRTASSHLRKGVASKLLHHILQEARHRSYRQVSLETGSMKAFEPAHNLYTDFGFSQCPPFADYREDRNSIFMTKVL